MGIHSDADRRLKWNGGQQADLRHFAIAMLALTLIAPWVLGQDLTETRRLAEQGNAEAQFSLGLMYDNGEGVPENDAEAMRWYRLAAEQDDADAQVNLGVMYANGEGVPEDDAEAVRWFRLAAEQGYADAQNNLGSCTPTARACRRITWSPMRGTTLPPRKGTNWATENKDNLRTRMNSDQIARAQELSATLFDRINN